MLRRIKRRLLKPLKSSVMTHISKEFDIKHEGHIRYIYWNNEKLLQLAPPSQLKNTLNKVSFLATSGPSINKIDFSNLKDFNFIAVNGSIKKLSDKGIIPKIYLCNDYDFLSNNPDALIEGVDKAEHSILSPAAINFLCQNSIKTLINKNIYSLERFDRRFGHPPLSSKELRRQVKNYSNIVISTLKVKGKKKTFGFSLDFTHGFFEARTVAYFALQAAYHAGSRDIYILGMDMGGKKHFYKEKRVINALDENYESNILPAFTLLRSPAILDKGLRLYNLSSGSRIPEDVIPKISLEQAISQIQKSSE